MVKVEYDREADAVYVKLRDAPYDVSEDVAENVVIDFDGVGRIIGIEILNASKTLGDETLKRVLKAEDVVVGT